MLSAPLRNQFAAAIRRLLRPVVRQLIAYGVPYAALNQIVKQLYVEVAEREFPLAFKRQTDSRLAVVTGIHRKEIAQLRRAGRRGAETPEVEDTVTTHAIGRWMAGPPYSDAAGAPQVLPYESVHPETPSFAGLVAESAADVPVRSVLDELLRVGAVVLRPDGQVVLQREGHIPATAAEGKLTLLGTDPAELFVTIMHNIEHPEAPRLQRKVVYDNVGALALETVREKARVLGEEFVRQANALLASYDRDRNRAAPGGAASRVAVGVYYFEEEGAPPAVSGKSDAGHAAPPGRVRRSK